MNAKMLRRGFRWLSIAAALAVLIVLMLWLAAAPLLALVVQRELRDAGWPEASVAGVSVGLAGVVIEQVSLAPGDALVVEGLRPRIGTGGIEHLAISRLRGRAELAADGTLVLPGVEPVDDGLPLDFLPADGIDLARADIRLTTPLGDAALSMAEVSVRRAVDGAQLAGRYALAHDVGRVEGTANLAFGDDGAFHGRLALSGGRIEAEAFAAGGLSGEAVMARPAAETPAITLDVASDDAWFAGTAAGALTLAAHWHDGAARFALATADAEIADAAVEGWFALADGDASMGLSGQVWLKGAPARGEISFDAELAVDAHRSFRGRLRLSGNGLSIPRSYEDGSIAFEADVEGTLERLRFTATNPWTLAFRPTAAVLPEGLGTLADEAVEVRLSPRAGEPQALELLLAEKAAHLLGALEITAGPSRLDTLAEMTASWADPAPVTAQAPGTSFAVSMTEAPFEAVVVMSEEERVVGGTRPALQLTGILSAEGVEHAAIELSGGDLTLPREQVALRGVSASVRLSGMAVVSSAISIAAIESLSAPPLWTPLSLDVGTTPADDGLAFDAVLSDPLGVLVLETSGEYGDGGARARIRLHPLRFTPGARQPGNLVPVLADYLQDASGTIEFQGDLSWHGEEWRSSGTLSLQDVGATLAGVAVAGVSTRAGFSTLLPPVTLPGQRATIDEVAFGVPLERGVVVYDIGSGGRLAVRSLVFDFAGGRLYSEPFIIDSADLRDIGFTLQAEEVDLSQILAFTGIEGLQGTGVVSGRVPVRLSERGLELDRGVLAAQTNGVLRYAPRQLPEFLQGEDLRSSMLREVLTNFHYEELSVSVTGESGDAEAQRVTLTARGANPDFLEGHPIELNVNFEGALLGALRSAVEVSGAAEIQEMSEQRERGNEETTQ